MFEFSKDYIYNWKDLKKRLFMLIYPIISLLIFRRKKNLVNTEI